MLSNCGAREDSWESLGLQGDQSVLKEMNHEYSLEELMLKLKLQYFSQLMRRADSFEKTLMLGKTEGRNINNLRYADDATLMEESKEELKCLFMRMQEWKAGLKLDIQKTKIMASGPITYWQIDGETMETVTDFISLGSRITAYGDCSHEIKRRLLHGRQAMTNLNTY